MWTDRQTDRQTEFTWFYIIRRAQFYKNEIDCFLNFKDFKVHLFLIFRSLQLRKLRFTQFSQFPFRKIQKKTHFKSLKLKTPNLILIEFRN